MITRCAFFEGSAKPGQEQAFHDFVTLKLVPLWSQFPGAIEVRVLSQSDADTPEPHYAMVLAITYADAAAMDTALQSDVRTQSRDATKELVKLFDGRIFHTVFQVRHNILR